MLYFFCVFKVFCFASNEPWHYTGGLILIKNLLMEVKNVCVWRLFTLIAVIAKMWQQEMFVWAMLLSNWRLPFLSTSASSSSPHLPAYPASHLPPPPSPLLSYYTSSFSLQRSITWQSVCFSYLCCLGSRVILTLIIFILSSSSVPASTPLNCNSF